MAFYTGSSADGSDMKETGGVYVSKDGKEWSNKPYPHQQKIINIENDILNYANGRYSYTDIYNQIKEHKCPLSKSRRDYIVDLIENKDTKENE